MKRNTLSTIYTALLDSGYESTDPIMEEIYKELNKNAEAKAVKEEEYAAAWEVVRGVMSDTPQPLTTADIFAEAEGDLPEGFTRNKVTYGLTHYWKDFVEVTDDKPKMYSLAK